MRSNIFTDPLIKSFSDMEVKEIIIVFKYEPFLEVEREYLKFENKLSAIFEKNAILTKVNDNSPPNVPRFLLESKNNRKLEVSIVNAVFKITPIGMTIIQVLENFIAKASTIHAYLKESNFVIEGFRLSVLMHYPLKDINYQVQNDIFKSLITIQMPSNLENISMTYVTKKDKYTHRNVVENYQAKEGTFDIKKDAVLQNKKFVKIPISSLKLVESGIAHRIVLDSNEDTDKLCLEELYSEFIQSVKKIIDDNTKQFLGAL